MSDPSQSVVRVAATPAEAKVLAAILQAEGVPAHVDSASLADEVAIARQLLNLQGIRVSVPTAMLARAREVLAATHVDEDELTVQALAAAPEAVAVPAPGRSPAAMHWGGWVAVGVVVAVMVALLVVIWR